MLMARAARNFVLSSAGYRRELLVGMTTASDETVGRTRLQLPVSYQFVLTDPFQVFTCPAEAKIQLVLLPESIESIACTGAPPLALDNCAST